MAPRDPILGITEAFNADKNPEQDQSRRRRLLRRQRQGAVAGMRAQGRSAADGKGRAAHLSADRRLGRLRQGGAGAGIWGRQRGNSREARDHRAGHRRHRRAEDRRRFPASAFRPTSQVWISDPSWENHRALFESAGFTGQQLPVLRSGHPRREFRRHAGRAENHAGRLDRACCTPAATTRPAPT